MSEGPLILVAGALLALAIGAALAAGRLRVPGLVLFLGLGMLLGSDGLDLIALDDIEVAKTVGIIALSLILFEGGLAAGFGEIRPVLRGSISLAVIATVGTAAITGIAAAWVLDLPLKQGLLLGAAVAASDAAAIFTVLRGSALKRRLALTLEAESAMNDPIAAMLVIGLVSALADPGYGSSDAAWFLAKQLVIGLAIGLAVGRAAVIAMPRLRFASQGLYPVATIAAAALAFGAADTLGGSGFLAVYVAGLLLGGPSVPARQTIIDFHSGVAWVGQIAMFVTLGLLVTPSGFGDIAFDGMVITLVLMFIARPIAVWVATRFGGYSMRETLLIGWSGLRGAVPIVLATFPVIAGVADRSFFDLVFFVVLASTLVQGATVEPLARWLGLTSIEDAMPRALHEVGSIRELGAEVLEFPVLPSHAVAGRRVNELGLPRDALVSIIVRGDQALLPRGSTPIEAGDSLHILVRASSRAEAEAQFNRWREGPVGDPEPDPIMPIGRAAIFSLRPWDPSDGDQGAPDTVGGAKVVRRLRTRRGEEGALVQLDDGRLAVTGEGVVAVGGSNQLFRHCRERIRRCKSEEARAWWQEVTGAVALTNVRAPRPPSQ